MKNFSSLRAGLLGALFTMTTTMGCGSSGETGTGGSTGSGGSGGSGGSACVIGEPSAQATVLATLAAADTIRSTIVKRGEGLLVLEPGKVSSVPVAGGAPTALASDAALDAAVPFAVAGDDVVYYGNDFNLRRLPLAGGPSVVLAKTATPVGSVAADPATATVYWHSLPNDSISQLTLPAGMKKPACPVPAGPTSGAQNLFHDGKGTLYWTQTDAENRLSVVRCTVGASTSEIVVKLTPFARSRIALLAEHVYFVESYDSDERGLKRVPLSGGAVELLDPEGTEPVHATADAVYYGAGSGKIRKLGAGSTCPVAVAKLQTEHGTFGAFTSDDTTLFGVTTDGQVFSVIR